VFAHAGQDAGWYCFTAGCYERRSGLMIMFIRHEVACQSIGSAAHAGDPLAGFRKTILCRVNC
jgi:hypothetical protein